MAASDVEPATAQSGKSPNSQQKSTSPQKDETTIRKEAMNHFVAGKRHMLVQDIAAAVTSLAIACEMLSAQFGETAKECADAYFHYGKALLEMARLESGVLGNALDGVPDGEDSDSSQVEDPEKMTEDEKEEVGVKVLEALDENFKSHEEKITALTNGHTKTIETNGKDESTEGDDDEESQEEESQEEGEESQEDEEMKDVGEKKDAEKEKGEKEKGETDKVETEKKDEAKMETETTDDKTKDTESVGEDEKTKEEKEAGDKLEQQAEDEEDPSNLQLAWEMLELAKVIYTKHATDDKEDSSTKADYEKKLCETYLTLGEVSLENENYTQAVDDLKACLTKRQEKLPADSRCIAETHYQLGVALGFHCQFEEAVTSLNDAIGVLTTRIEKLKNKTESKDETRTDDAFYTREREIEELEKLLPEIREKIQDTKEMKDETIRKMKEEAGFSNGAATSGADKPVSTIPVRKRAHSKEDEKLSPKKAHLENGSSNGTK